MTTFDIRNSARKTSISRAIIFTLASLSLLAAIAPVSPAMAMQNNGGGADGVTKGDLENDGWTCEVSGVGFWVCSKPGHKDQWCDTHSCGPAPAIHKLPQTNRAPHGGVLAH